MDMNLFENEEFDVEKFRKALNSPVAKKNYVIYFTPRSGSSWLGDVLKNTGKLGNPGEWLNPEFIPRITKAVNTNSVERYFAIMRRRQNVGGVFGIEATYFQLNKIFPENSEFFNFFKPTLPSFYLIREDIVSQAVSLAKAVGTQIFHAPSTTTDKVVTADVAFQYNSENILKWLRHIRNMEIETEAFFERFAISPIRLSYEVTTSKRELGVAKSFAKRLGVLDLDEGPVATPHVKIATSINDVYAERFRQENKALIDTMDADRAPMIEAARLAQEKFFGGK